MKKISQNRRLVGVLAAAAVARRRADRHERQLGGRSRPVRDRASSPTSAASTTRASTSLRSRACKSGEPGLRRGRRALRVASGGRLHPEPGRLRAAGLRLVIGVGFLLAALATVAKRFPNTSRSWIDVHERLRRSRRRRTSAARRRCSRNEAATSSATSPGSRRAARQFERHQRRWARSRCRRSRSFIAGTSTPA